MTTKRALSYEPKDGVQLTSEMSCWYRITGREYNILATAIDLPHRQVHEQYYRKIQCKHMRMEVDTYTKEFHLKKWDKIIR